MRRLRHRFEHLEAPPVLERRNLGARGGDRRRIDLRKDHAGLLAALGDDLAPRIDHDRMAERLAAVLVRAALRADPDLIHHSEMLLAGAIGFENIASGIGGVAVVAYFSSVTARPAVYLGLGAVPSARAPDSMGRPAPSAAAPPSSARRFNTSASGVTRPSAISQPRRRMMCIVNSIPFHILAS